MGTPLETDDDEVCCACYPGSPCSLDDRCFPSPPLPRAPDPVVWRVHLHRPGLFPGRLPLRLLAPGILPALCQRLHRLTLRLRPSPPPPPPLPTGLSLPSSPPPPPPLPPLVTTTT